MWKKCLLTQSSINYLVKFPDYQYTNVISSYIVNKLDTCISHPLLALLLILLLHCLLAALPYCSHCTGMVLKLHLTLKYFFMYNAYYTQIYSLYVYTCVNMHICAFTWIFMCMCICVYLQILTYICMCVELLCMIIGFFLPFKLMETLL